MSALLEGWWVNYHPFDSPFLLILSLNLCVPRSDRRFEKTSGREELIDVGHLFCPLFLEQCEITGKSMNFQLIQPHRRLYNRFI